MRTLGRPSQDVNDVSQLAAKLYPQLRGLEVGQAEKRVVLAARRALEVERRTRGEALDEVCVCVWVCG